MTHGEGAQTMADTGTFPSLKKILRSDSFTDPTTESNKKTNDYFGGQNVNEVLSAAAQRPTEKFQYLPYNPVRPDRLRRRSLQGLLRRHHPGEGA